MVEAVYPIESPRSAAADRKASSAPATAEEDEGLRVNDVAEAALRPLHNWLKGLLYGADDDAVKFVVGRRLVELQGEDHNDEDTPVYKLLHDSDEEFERNVKEKYDILRKDPVGACVFHIAYLYGVYKRGLMLVNQYPDQCLGAYGIPDDYEGDRSHLPYTGETLLHMVVMQGNIEQATELLERYHKHFKSDPKKLKDWMDAEVTGHFFAPKKDYEPKQMGMYYGDKALHMAVCCNNKDMVNLLISYYEKLGESLTSILGKQDKMRGNNVLHLCALHNLEGMYDYILSKFTEPAKKLTEPSQS